VSTSNARAWLAVVAMILVVGGVVACESPTGQAPDRERPSREVISPPQVGAVPQADRPRDLRLPIEVYRLTNEQRTLYGRARTLLINQCLSRFGPTIPLQPFQSDAELGPMDRRYGVADAITAAQWGYHLGPNAPTPGQGDPAATMSAQELLLLSGSANGRPNPQASPAPTFHGIPVPPGGCSGEASRTLGLRSPDPLGQTLTTSIEFDAFEQSQTDQRTKQAIASWAGCMSAAGHLHADPLTVGGTFDLKLPKPGSAELQTAAADVACKAQTNLVGRWFAIESAYESALIQLKLAELTEVRAKLDTLLAKASATIAAHG
jgi:hypothetical protein